MRAVFASTFTVSATEKPHEQDLLPAGDQASSRSARALCREEFLELAPARRVQGKEAVPRPAGAHGEPLRGQLIKVEAGDEGIPHKALRRHFLRQEHAFFRARFPRAHERHLKRFGRFLRQPADAKERIIHPNIHARQIQPRACAPLQEGDHLFHMRAFDVLLSTRRRKRHAHRPPQQRRRERRKRRPVISVFAPLHCEKPLPCSFAQICLILRQQFRCLTQRRHDGRVHMLRKVGRHIQPDAVAGAVPEKVRFVRAEGEPLLRKIGFRSRCGEAAAAGRITRPRRGFHAHKPREAPRRAQGAAAAFRPDHPCDAPRR